MKVSEAITQRNLALCNEKNITPNKLGKLSSLDPSTITSIFYGKSKNTGLVTISYICDGLNITIKEFFDDLLFDNIFDD